jgi:hypothetical protein
MKRLLYTSSTLFFIIIILFTTPYTVLANEGDGEHDLEMEVNGYHITLTSQNEWIKGENAIVVTLEDSMWMPLSNADVEILIAPKVNEHAETGTDLHGAEPQHDTMSGMDMSAPATEVPDMTALNEEAAEPISMTESDEPGMYMVETHFESSGEHEIQVFFHVNGEMFQADFLVNISKTSSKTLVLWSFVMVNVGLITSAGILKKQSIPVKGG